MATNILEFPRRGGPTVPPTPPKSKAAPSALHTKQGWQLTAAFFLANPWREYVMRPSLGNESGRGDFERGIILAHLCWRDPVAYETIHLAADREDAEYLAQDRGETVAREHWEIADPNGNANPYLLRREIVIFTPGKLWLAAFKTVNGLAPPAAVIADNWFPDNRDTSCYRHWRARADQEARARSATLTGVH